jgi:hypothetical protein
MALYLVRPALYGAVFVATKIPRSGPKVDYERISPIGLYDWKLDARQFWQARTFSSVEAATKALAIVHAAGHNEFKISANPWELDQ